MDKVKIIDGVDVSECEHYRAKLKYKLPFDDYTVEQDKCHYSGIEIIQNCKGNKGCIYKQLKRLEQENEELKKHQCSFENCDNFERYSTEIHELKQENEQLKKLKFKSDGIELLQDANLNLHKANIKYRQALQEIREYCEEQNLKADYTACEVIRRIEEVIGAEE